MSSEKVKRAVDRIQRHINNACEDLSPEDYGDVLEQISDYVGVCKDALADDNKRRADQ